MTATEAPDVLPAAAVVPVAAAPLTRRRRRPTVLRMVALAWIVLVVLLALFANFLPLHEPTTRAGQARLTPFENMDTPLGTDRFGRDVLSRLIYGARTSLGIGVTAAIFAMVVGGVLGLMAGYFRRGTDSVLSTITNVMLAFPPLIFLIALGAMVGPSVPMIIIALAVLATPGFLRLNRANTIRFSNREFVSAAQLLGASRRRILFREILPNLVAPLTAYVVVACSALIVAEASLSFLGLGIPPPNPSWGSMIADGQPDLGRNPSLVLIPIIALFLTVYAINILGDWARSRFDIGENQL